MVEKTTVSVVIPVYNGGDSFRKCLAALSAMQDTFYELVVVADGDTDGSWQLAKSFGAKTLRNPFPRGPAFARNMGARAASGDILFFVDADVVVAPRVIDKISAAFSEDPSLSALIGSYDDAPGDPGFLSQYRNLLHHIVHQKANEKASTFWGACGAIRRKDFLAVGGFDQGYRHPSIEDIELGYRLRNLGYEIRMRKDIQVKHLKRWTAFSILKTDFFRRALPWTALILQQGHLLNDLNLKMSARTSVVLSYAILGLSLAVPLIPQFSLAALALGLVFLLINAPTYQSFRDMRGSAFALKVIPWHWFYFLYSGLAFGIGIICWWLYPNLFSWITGRSNYTEASDTVVVPSLQEQLPTTNAG